MVIITICICICITPQPTPGLGVIIANNLVTKLPNATGQPGSPRAEVSVNKTGLSTGANSTNNTSNFGENFVQYF